MNRLEASFLVDVALAARNAVAAIDPDDACGVTIPGMLDATQRGAELLLGCDAETAWRLAYRIASTVLLDDD